jgi:hypothetical protein
MPIEPEVLGELMARSAAWSLTAAPTFKKLLFRREWPHFYAFDVLSIDGEDMTGFPLLDRKRRLLRIMPFTESRLLYLDHSRNGHVQAVAAARRGNRARRPCVLLRARGAPAPSVRPVRPFCDDALKIVLACHAKQITAAAVNASSQRWPRTCATARKPSSLGSKMKSG